MPLWFWEWVHVNAEKLWHWVYYKKVAPRQKPYKVQEIIYSEQSYLKGQDSHYYVHSGQGLLRVDTPLREEEKQSDQSHD